MRRLIITIMTFCAISAFGQTQDSIIQVFVYDEGKYIGEVRNGKPHGRGRMMYASDDPVRYEYYGNWVNGKKHGQGVMYWKNLEKYEGNWKDDLEDGEGFCKNANGDIYEGQWKNGAENGEGTYYYANGDKYVGNWVNGLWNGKGCLYTHDGHEFCGTWESTMELETGYVKIECNNDEGHTLFSMVQIGSYLNIGTHMLNKAMLRKFRNYVNKCNKTN